MTLFRLLFVLLWLTALPAWAQGPELCEAAASRAARETGVPVDVLQAIALTETGRMQGGRLRPWPWTANAEGRGHWFATRDEARTFARQLLDRGQRLFDLGCFQINWRWHGQEFTRPEDLLDPLTAARYAARHLAALHAEFGSWEAAAGAYHSRTPQHAARYRTRFAAVRARLNATDARADARASPPTGPRPVLQPAARTGTAPDTGLARANAYPLLMARADPSGHGVGPDAIAPGASLVPATLPPARPRFEIRP